MKTLSLLVILILVAAVFATANPARLPKRLFDGKSFKGWNGNLQIFRIENGAIGGGSLKDKIARNEFLCTGKAARIRLGAIRARAR